MKYINLLFIITFFLSSCSNKNEEEKFEYEKKYSSSGTEVNVKISKTKIPLSGFINMQIETILENYNTSPESILSELKDFSVVSINSEKNISENGRIIFIEKIILEPEISGTAALPDIEIMDKKSREPLISIKNISIEIASALDPNKEIVIKENFTYKNPYAALILGVLITALLISGVLFYSRKKLSKVFIRNKLIHKNKIIFNEKEINSLLESKQFSSLFQELEILFKTQANELFGINIMNMTGPEILKSPILNEKIRKAEDFKNFISTAEKIKYMKYIPNQKESIDSINFIRDFLKQEKADGI